LASASGCKTVERGMARMEERQRVIDTAFAEFKKLLNA